MADLVSDSEDLDLENNVDQDDGNNEENDQPQEDEEEQQEEEQNENGDDHQGSEFEYSSSDHEEKSSNDSYAYPFETSSDDSWASLDSDGCLQKILAKLPTYDPPDSDENANKSGSPSPSQYSDHGNDSAVENETRNDDTAKYVIEKLLPMVEEFEMIVEYDGDDETEPSGKEYVKKSNKDSQNGVLPQAMTIPAATPSPPSDDEEDDKRINTRNSKTNVGKITITPTPQDTKPKKKVPATPKESKDIADPEPIQGKLFDDTKEPVKPKEAKKKEEKLKTALKEPTGQQLIASSSNPAPSNKTAKDISKSANTTPRTSTIDTKKKPSQPTTSRISAPAVPLDAGAGNKQRRAKTSFGMTNQKKNDNDNDNDTKTKKTRHRDRNTKRGKKIIEGDKVLVQNKYTAIIRYIGRDENNKEVIYGVELLDADAVGEHNGTVDGKKYFECPDKKGLLVTKKDFKPIRDVPVHNQLKYNKGRNNALLFGDIVSALFGERLKVARVENDRRVKKLGPRDIGRVRGWRGGDDEYGVEMDKNNNFLEERFAKRNKATGDETAKTEKKLGPRDIGTARGWKGADYKIETNQNSDLFEERSYPKKQASNDESAETIQRKEGPRDYQKPTTWKGAKYDIAKNANGFLEERPLRRKSKTASPTDEDPAIERKLGPRDVGKNKYHRPDWDKQKPEEEAQDDTKKEAARERKLGPRDYGKNKNYQGADYELKDSNGGFLEERVVKRKDGPAKVEKKAGPREIGKAKYHRPDWDKNVDNEQT